MANSMRRDPLVQGELAAKLRESGMTTLEIARETGVTDRCVRQWIERYRKFLSGFGQTTGKLPGRSFFIPLFPVASFTPDSECPHHGPLPPGSRFVCMAHECTGWEGHPGMIPPPHESVKKSKAKFVPRGFK